MFNSSPNLKKKYSHPIDNLNIDDIRIQKEIGLLLQPTSSETFLSPTKDDMIRLSLHKVRTKQKNFIQIADNTKRNPGNDIWKLKETENPLYSPKIETYRHAPFIPDPFKKNTQNLPAFVKEILKIPQKLVPIQSHNNNNYGFDNNNNKKSNILNNDLSEAISILPDKSKNILAGLYPNANVNNIDNQNISHKIIKEINDIHKEFKDYKVNLTPNKFKKYDIKSESTLKNQDKTKNLIRLPIIESTQKKLLYNLHITSDLKNQLKQKISATPRINHTEVNKTDQSSQNFPTRISTLPDDTTNNNEAKSSIYLKVLNTDTGIDKNYELKLKQNKLKLKRSQKISSFNLFRPKTLKKFPLHGRQSLDNHNFRSRKQEHFIQKPHDDGNFIQELTNLIYNQND